MVMAIGKMDIWTRRATCWPIVNDSVDFERTISTNIQKLQKTDTLSLTAVEKKELEEHYVQSKKETLSNPQRVEYAQQYRRVSVLSTILAEIDSALGKRQRAHVNFILGLCTPNIDCVLLQMDFSGKVGHSRL